MPQQRAGLIVAGLSVLCLAQLAGEAVVRLAGLPVPGAVLGLVLLAALLLVRGRISEGVRRTAEALLAHLQMLFVPAAAVAFLHLGDLAGELPALLAAVLASTLAGLAATAFVWRRLARPDDEVRP